jgi:hypothetical protein
MFLWRFHLIPKPSPGDSCDSKILSFGEDSGEAKKPYSAFMVIISLTSTVPPMVRIGQPFAISVASSSEPAFTI